MSQISFDNMNKIMAGVALALPADVLFAMAHFRQTCDQIPNAMFTIEDAAVQLTGATAKLKESVRAYVKAQLEVGQEKASSLDQVIFLLQLNVEQSDLELTADEQFELVCNLYVSRIVEMVVNMTSLAITEGESAPSAATLH